MTMMNKHQGFAWAQGLGQDHQLDDAQRRRIDRLPPFVRKLLPIRILIELNDEEIAELIDADITPDTIFGPGLLHAHNMTREPLGLRGHGD